jgi:ubiquinone/menaquinone biosynthesis C-methylase UbiE
LPRPVQNVHHPKLDQPAMADRDIVTNLILEAFRGAIRRDHGFFMTNSKNRFDGRASNYVNYRPSYPQEAIEVIIAAGSLESGEKVADIGSGTGIFSELLVKAGFDVFAVEPNEHMRTAAEDLMKGHNEARFHSVAGSAEQTTLDDHSVGVITAAQAFHWFDPETTRIEMQRILRHDGWLALIWNQRDTRTPFQQAYEAVLRQYVPDYDHLVHTRINDGMIAEFFEESTLQTQSLLNRQILDLDGLLGRMSSSSYVPSPDLPAFDRIVDDLTALFEQNQQNGKVAFDYETRLFIGQLSR